ncbi:hypothetical protein C8R44DRAFT_866224 [Mycena epipterygia]|nr:hypothetical protein C8R44DRAFT_866224 [Mycena epipterygia]
MFKPAFYVFCFASLAQYVSGSPVPSPTANLVASDAILTRTPNLSSTHRAVLVESAAPTASSDAACPGGACGTFPRQTLRAPVVYAAPSVVDL